MEAKGIFLAQLDGAWEHKWESLQGALEGVTEEEAAWQAPCYAKEEREEGWPPPGTILWQVAHIAHCKRYYRKVILHAGEERPPVDARTPLATLAEELAALTEAHRAQRDAIASLTDEELQEHADFLTHTIRHDTWHAAQIALARRLHRKRQAT